MAHPLYLTFDDGPDPTWTPRVMETLARHGATATFFVLGWRVRESPMIAASLVAAGHRVELHGDAHLDHEHATPQELADDTNAALNALGRCGVIPQWWRLPFGRAGTATLDIAQKHRLRIVGWDADTRDWRGDGWIQQPAQVSDAAERGGVVLLHDAIALGTPRVDAENTLEVTEHLLRHAKKFRTPALRLPDAATDEAIRDNPRASPFERSQATLRAWQAENAQQETRRPGAPRGGKT
jgi:peptidoglycan/xylan/chitin deacetylase (PgdA/CDA1 family)